MRFAMNKFHKTLAKNCAGAPQIHRTPANINTNTSCKNTSKSCTTQIHQQKRPIHNAIPQIHQGTNTKKAHPTQAQNCARAPHSIPGRQQAQR